jgi:hypothetical protein
MGTDIQLFAEVQQKDGWHFLGEVEPNTEPLGETDAIDPLWRPVPHYDVRNMALLRLLGRDRSTSHEATDDPLPLIAPLRGLPADLSPEIHAWVQYWDMDRGSSWLLLPEVLAFPWHGARRKEAMVSRRVARLFRNPTAPFPYAKWPADEPISYSAYKKRGVTVQWTETYAETAGAFLSDLAIPLSQQYPPSTIRFVFWFC